MKLKHLTGAVLCAALLSANIPQAAALSGVSGWAQTEVGKAAAAGLMPSAFGALAAREDITRAEFCAVALRLFEAGTGRVAEVSNARPFADTQDTAVTAANALGLVSGRGNGIFAPGDTITRQELCVMLGNVLRAGVGEADEAGGNPLGGFTDAGDVAAWAARDLSAMVSSGVISGIVQPDGVVTLSPRETTTREQSLMMAIRFLETYDMDAEYKGDPLGSLHPVDPEQAGEADPEQAGKADPEQPQIPSIPVPPVTETDPPAEDSITVPAGKPTLPADKPLTDAEKEILVFGTNGRGFNTQAEAEAAMCDITVPVWRLGKDGTKTAGKMTLTVHKNLAAIYEAIFSEIFAGDERFPIKDGGSYAWRANAKSEHRWGTAIDLNWEENMECNIDENGNITLITTGKLWEPGENPYSIPADGDVVRAFAKYGFAWGGDAWKSKRDYMHFSYFGR